MLVNVNDVATYSIDRAGFDLTALPFVPTFDASHLGKGQRMRAATSLFLGGSPSPGYGATLNQPTEVTLTQQALAGTVSGLAESGQQQIFTLTPAAGSVFAALAGSTQVTVYTQSVTRMAGNLGSGAKVVLRGLLFYSGGQYSLVASRITVQ